MGRGVNKRPDYDTTTSQIFENHSKLVILTAWLEDVMTFYDQSEEEAAAYILQRVALVKKRDS